MQLRCVRQACAMPTYAELQVTQLRLPEGCLHPEELVVQARRWVWPASRSPTATALRAPSAPISRPRRSACVSWSAAGSSSLTVRRCCAGRPITAGLRPAQLATDLRQRLAAKGGCTLTLDDVLAHDEGQVFALPAARDAGRGVRRAGPRRLRQRWRRSLYLAVLSHRYAGDDEGSWLAALAHAAGVKPLGTNDVHYHHPDRRPLQDVDTKASASTEDPGRRTSCSANAGAPISPPAEMARLFRHCPQALSARWRSSSAAGSRWPKSPTPTIRSRPLRRAHPRRGKQRGPGPGRGTLSRSRAGKGAQLDPARARADREAALRPLLPYRPRHRPIRAQPGHPCQGRGSAANSVVCYALGITAVDPSHVDVLFERFVSAERDEPPYQRRRLRARASRGGDPVD